MRTPNHPSLSRCLAGLGLAVAALLLGASPARANDALRANEVRIVLDDALAQVGALRTRLPAEAWRPLGEAVARLQSLRGEIVTAAATVADRESRLDPLSTHVQRLRIEAESAIERHNRRVEQHDATMAGLHREADALDIRIREHNGGSHVPRTPQQVVAYDAQAARLNQELASLQRRAATLLATATREVTQLRVAASAKERTWTEARASFQQQFAQFEQERTELHGRIDEAVRVLQALAGSAQRVLLAQAGHGLDMARDTVERPIGTPSKSPEVR